MAHHEISSLQNTTLSVSARLLYYIGPPSFILLTALASPRTALIAPLTFIPTAWLVQRWKSCNKANPSRRGELEPMIWIYLTTGAFGIVSVAAFQMAVCTAAIQILFRNDAARKYFLREVQRTTIKGLTPSELADRAKLALSWQNWVFNAVLSFAAAGFFEELLKYLPVFVARRRGTLEQRQQRNRAYIDYIFAAALSFGVFEGTGFLYGAIQAGEASWQEFVLSIVERVAIAPFGHLAVAALTALRAVRRDFYGDKLSWWGVIGPAALFHGAADFVCLTASALGGNVGWIHPTGFRDQALLFIAYSGVFGSAAWQVKKEWDSLGRRDGET